MCACHPASDIAGSAPASCGPGSEVSAAWGVGCKTVRATTMAATTRPAAIQNARWHLNMFSPRGAQHRAGPQLDDRHDRGLGRACGPGRCWAPRGVNMLRCHLAFWIAAGLVVAAIVVALTVCQPTPPAADTSEPGPQLAGADPAMSEAG